MSTLIIDGVELPSPTKYDLSYMDMDKSGRTSSGLMVRDRIGTKRKLELDWGVLSSSDTSKILKAVKPPFVDVEFYDLETDQEATGVFYAGDRKSKMILFKNGAPSTKGLSFNLIER